MTERMLRRTDVEKLTGLSRSSIYNYLHDERWAFPKPMNMGAGSVRWREADIHNWMNSRSPRQYG